MARAEYLKAEMIKWLLANQYYAETRSYWFHRSKHGKLIRPFEKAFIHVQKLPGTWQKDRITWYTQKEFGNLQLKYGRKLDYRKHK